MSTFQYPANPEDGDIIVQPQEDGTLIKGVYNASTNTWEVGQIPVEPGIPGPEGPTGAKGEKGDPGAGMQISGIVQNLGDLPAPAEHPLQFWIVDTENVVYYSDGNSWYDLGGPIEGPTGEAGQDGTNGTNGSNGAPGKGWTGTTVIDDRPTSYQVRFESNDGLQFTTDNIMGPTGATGSLTVATATDLGGIKIGRGLNIDASGTASVGETSVDLESTPLEPNGYILPYRPVYYQFMLDNQVEPGNTKEYYSQGQSTVLNWATTVVNPVTMPAKCTEALVWWSVPSVFQTDDADANNNYYNGETLNFRCYLAHKLTLGSDVYFVGRGGYEDLPSNETNKGSHHNFTPIYVDKGDGTSSLTSRSTSTSFNKLELITFPEGYTLEPKIDTDITDMSTGTITIGGLRAIILPMRAEDEVSQFLVDGFTDVEDTTVFNLPAPSQDQANAADLRSRTVGAIEVITTILNLPQTTDAEVAQLEALRDNILGIVDLPGTYAELSDILSGYVLELNTSFLQKRYRFEDS